MSGRILVVDDTATNQIILKAKLAAQYYDVLLADNGETALEIAENEYPDIILLDVVMPGMDGYEVCEKLKQNPVTAHIPVIMVTSANEPEERVRGLEVGACDFLSKPIDDTELLARVRNLLRVKMMFDELKLRDSTARELGLGECYEQAPDTPDNFGAILVSPSSLEQSIIWGRCIQCRVPFQVITAKGEKDTLAMAQNARFDAFVISQNQMDGGDGLRLLSALRANIHTRQAVIILVVEDGSSQTAAKCLDMGASDYIHAPFDANELVARLRSQVRRKNYSDSLRSTVHTGLRMAVVDPLTGLYNRRYADQHIKRTAEQSRSSGENFAVMMMDLDHFKNINDTYGHDAGDIVLKEVARRLQENLRGVDLIARLGGEEFLVVMPDTDLVQAKAAAERLREAIEKIPFIVDNGTDLGVTVSIGVTFGHPDEARPEKLISEADEALYGAKSSGRNRVIFFEDAA